jgi:putative metallopeptidase
MTEYSFAPEVADIAAPLIETHHEHLLGVRIDYVFRDKAASNRGRAKAGTARKVSALTALLAGADGPFFVIEIAADIWKLLPEWKRRALVDHEFLHCGLNEDGAPVLLPHDLEEFVEVVRRHGRWTSWIDAFAEAVQEALPFGEEAE